MSKTYCYNVTIQNIGENNLPIQMWHIGTDPTKAVSALAGKNTWLPAFILIGVQALLSGFFALMNLGAGPGIDKGEFLFIAFFFTFISSFVSAASAMAMYLAIGMAVTGDVTLKAAFSTFLIRCCVCLPLTFIK